MVGHSAYLRYPTEYMTGYTVPGQSTASDQLDIRPTGYPGDWTSGQLDIRSTEYPVKKISGHLDIRSTGYPVNKISGQLCIRSTVYPVNWISGLSQLKMLAVFMDIEGV